MIKGIDDDKDSELVKMISETKHFLYNIEDDG